MPLLPSKEADEHTLDYHVGVANLEELIGEPFDMDAFREVNQFLYMGEFDDSDTITFKDAFTDDQLRETALEVYGTYMIDDRFPYSRALYEKQEAGAVFRMYEKEGHRPVTAVPDLAEFHERSLAGDEITDLRADLGGKVPNKHASVNYAPEEPKPGDQVALDATNTELENREPVSFEWEFENGETATGSKTTHTFDSSGQYSIRLTVTDDAGNTHQATEYVHQQEETGETNQTEQTEQTEQTDETPGQTENISNGDNSAAEVPGFGIGDALAGLSGLSYLLKQRVSETKTESGLPDDSD